MSHSNRDTLALILLISAMTTTAWPASRGLAADDVAEQKKREIDKKIGEIDVAIARLLQNDGEDLQKVFDAKFAVYSKLKAEVRHLEGDLADSLRQREDAMVRAKKAPFTAKDFAQVDPSMKEMIQIQSQLEAEVQALEAKLGANDPAAIAARARLQLRSEAIKKYRDVLDSKYFIKVKPDGSSSALVKKNLDVEIAALKRVQELRDNFKMDLQDLSTRIHTVSRLRADRARLEADRRRAGVEAK